MAEGFPFCGLLLLRDRHVQRVSDGVVRSAGAMVVRRGRIVLLEPSRRDEGLLALYVHRVTACDLLDLIHPENSWVYLRCHTGRDERGRDHVHGGWVVMVMGVVVGGILLHHKVGVCRVGLLDAGMLDHAERECGLVGDGSRVGAECYGHRGDVHFGAELLHGCG